MPVGLPLNWTTIPTLPRCFQGLCVLWRYDNSTFGHEYLVFPNVLKVPGDFCSDTHPNFSRIPSFTRAFFGIFVIFEWAAWALADPGIGSMWGTRFFPAEACPAHGREAAPVFPPAQKSDVSRNLNQLPRECHHFFPGDNRLRNVCNYISNKIFVM